MTTSTDRPSIVFAYTIKGWGLPIAGDPLNHAAMLSEEQIATLRQVVGNGRPTNEWDRFPAGRVQPAESVRGSATS